MSEIEEIRREIEEIKKRNERVEIDKDWEISWSRKITIAILTYIVIVSLFYFADLPKPFINAVVPTIGFLLSTFSLPFFKKFWIEFISDKNETS